MPTYDYQCDRCGKTFEIRQRISAEPLTACQFCGGPVHRLIGPSTFILKGGGWYMTDYPSEARKKGLASEKKAPEPAAAPAESTAAAPAASTPAPASGSTSTAS